MLVRFNTSHRNLTTMKYKECLKHLPETPLLQYEFFTFSKDLLMTQKQYEHLLDVSLDVLTEEIEDSLIPFWIYVETLPIQDLYEMAKYTTNITFLTIRLDSTQKKAYKAFYDDNIEDLETLLHDMIASDVKMSVSFDTTRDVFIVSMTGKKENKHNANLCYTSRSAHMTDAMMLAVYKHHVLAKEGSWALAETSSDDWG